MYINIHYALLSTIFHTNSSVEVIVGHCIGHTKQSFSVCFPFILFRSLRIEFFVTIYFRRYIFVV